MKARRVLSCLATGMLSVSLAACTVPATQPAPDAVGETPTEEAGTTETPAAAGYAYDEAASITFADGNFGFLGSDTTVNPAAKETVLELVERDGHKMVKAVSAEGGKLYIGIQMDALLGADVSKVASVEFGLETEQGSEFSAKSGKIYSFLGGVQSGTPWSIYVENGNPKTVSAEVSGAAAGDYLVLSMEDSGAAAGLEGATLYIHSISFKDASGAVLAVDTAAEYCAAVSGEDRSNLYAMTGAVEYDAKAAGGAWAQADILTIDDDMKAKLVPGAVIEIEYSSTTGNMWIVMNGAEAGWMRVGVGDADGSGQGYAYTNNSGNIAQITYEQIAEYCGEDVSTWGGTIQAESDGDWEVFSVNIGMAAPSYTASGALEIGQAASGEGWAQADIVTIDDDVASALVPGTVLEIDYTSETGELWIVMPDAEAGWKRVGVGDADGSGQGYAVYDGSKCYIPYEMIAEVLGSSNIGRWGERIQAEASSKWEVFGVKIGKAVELQPLNSVLKIEGSEAKGEGWAQADVIKDLTAEDVAAALVPGSVVSISYTSETGNMWIVMNGAEAGWMRVGVGDADGSGQGYAACNGSVCQIPYEMIAEYCGKDVSKWGSTMQCESDGAWEVYSVSIGQAK
ncbi:MAG: hypothetical protein IJ600_01990 [Lachnospiraceae bacterium]|nr:hypothetical protein [Lachnospiraceae bacterium]